LNFRTLALKLGNKEKIVEIEKFAFFNKGRLFQISSHTTVLNVGTF